MDENFCKLEIFIPESHLEVLAEALRSVDAGHVGRYEGCFSYAPVTGCWRPLPGAVPYLGREGELSREPEVKVEVLCRRDRADRQKYRACGKPHRGDGRLRGNDR